MGSYEYILRDHIQPKSKLKLTNRQFCEKYGKVPSRRYTFVKNETTVAYFRVCDAPRILIIKSKTLLGFVKNRIPCTIYRIPNKYLKPDFVSYYIADLS